VHFSDLFNESTTKESVLRLENYQGTVLIPSNTTLQITATAKKIDGILGAPAYIESEGDINLVVSKESELELCLAVNCEVKVNDIVSTAINTERMREPVITRSYESFSMRYRQYLKKKPNNTDTFNLMDLCMFYNLLYLKKDNGKISLHYIPPKFELREEVESLNKRNMCRFYQNEIINARNEGKLYKASYINTQFENFKTQNNIFIDQNNKPSNPNSQESQR
jgi:hypothetical protein